MRRANQGFIIVAAQTTTTMPKNSSRAKPVRKPLVDISNGGGKSSKPSNKKKVFFSAEEEEDEDEEEEVLDRLLLAHSDLSNLIKQIDTLVVQAFKVKLTSKKERKEIQSFTNVLSDIHSSLKAWVPRFQNAVSSPSVEPDNYLDQSLPSKTPTANEEICRFTDSPEQIELESLVSPSPLVTWCADRTVESGRQLFLLTPLPRSKALSSKCQGSSRLVLESVTHVDEPPNTVGLPSTSNSEMENTLECGIVSTPKLANRDRSAFLMTPRLKTSPPKSCVLLEPISESLHHDFNDLRKSTPYPFGSQNWGSSQASESPSSSVSDNLALKYPELLGIKQTQKSGIPKKEIETSMKWLMSPPKSCALMEPPDEKMPINLSIKEGLFSVGHALNHTTSHTVASDKDSQAAYKSTSEYCNQEAITRNAMLESTPIWKEPESAIHAGKRPGENTLKKELWTKFEAASSSVIHFDVSDHQEPATKGFLDRLEEVSCER